MKPLLLLFFFSLFSVVMYGQYKGCSYYTKQSIDSIARIESDQYQTVLACGPHLSKRYVYKSYDSDTMIATSGFVFNINNGLQYNWSYNYHDNQLIRVVVSLNYLHQPAFYKASYYFNGGELLHVEGENTKYSNLKNILQSAERRYWEPLSVK